MTNIKEQVRETRHRIRWDRLKNPKLERVFAGRLKEMCRRIPGVADHYDTYIAVVVHTGLWTLGISNFGIPSETEEMLQLRRRIEELWENLHSLTYREPREFIKATINRLSKIYRRQVKLHLQSRFERWKAQCLSAEPRDRWRMVTKWTRPRARTYNFAPFEV